MRALLPFLPDDILLVIFTFLPILSVLHLRQTCKALLQITRSPAIWHVALQQLRESGVPCPSIHTPAQTEVTDSDDPEAAFRRAVQLYAAWRQPHPTATRTALLELSPTSSAANERILYAVGLSVLSHTRGRVLLTMHITVADAPPGNPPGPRRTGVLQVWDLWTGEPSTNLEGRGDTPLTAAVHGAQRVAELRVKSRSEAVLDAASGSITGLFRLAIAEREPDALCIYSLRVADAPEGLLASAFHRVAVFEGAYSPLSFCDRMLVAKDASDGIIVFKVVESVEHTSLSYFCKLDDDGNTPQRSPLMAAHISLAEEFIAIFRQQSIAVFALPFCPAAHSFEASPVLSSPTILGTTTAPSPDLAIYHPRQVDRFPWKIYDLVVRPRPTHTLPTEDTGTTLDLFLRFDSYLPWPVNMLHHVRTRPHANNAGARREMAAGWPSPVALFARTALALGARGTALWLDSGTDGGHGAGTAQRVAARGLYAAAAATRTLLAGMSCAPPAPAASREMQRGEGVETRGAAGQDATGAWTPAHVLGVSEAGPAAGTGRFTLVTIAVQEPRDGEEWVHVALDEDEGIVAIMSANGRVAVLDYAPSA